MSDFEEYIKNKYPEDYAVLSTMYSNQAMEELYPDQFEVWQHQQAIIDEHTEVIKLQDADLRKYEKQIESLKEQLNNMEACYVEKKKECEGLQGQVGEALEEIQRALNCCESTETACVLGELVKVLRGKS